MWPPGALRSNLMGWAHVSINIRIMAVPGVEAADNGIVEPGIPKDGSF
jgi:hypothetical protein